MDIVQRKMGFLHKNMDPLRRVSETEPKVDKVDSKGWSNEIIGGVCAVARLQQDPFPLSRIKTSSNEIFYLFSVYVIGHRIPFRASDFLFPDRPMVWVWSKRSVISKNQKGVTCKSLES